MGNRALIQFKNGQEYSPVIYSHWNGYDIPAILEQLKIQMRNRSDDLSYVTARMIGRLAVRAGIEADSGIGVWNTDRLLIDSDSHSDAGVFIVDIAPQEWHVTCLAGYEPEGFSTIPFTHTR